MSVRKRRWTTSKGKQREAWIVEYTNAFGRREIETFPRENLAKAYARSLKMNVPATSTALSSAIENVLMRGDLSKLTEPQRIEYYNAVCRSIGLNPLTRPFEYITLSGKLTLYARRDAADQLRKLNGISVEISDPEISNGLMTVHAKAKDRDGRTDEDLGVVPWSDKLAGEFAANMVLKAVTKAKRRVTLSLSGLGFLDETEVEDVAEAKTFREPESGPQKTRQEWNDYGLWLLSAVRECKNPTEMADLVNAAEQQLSSLEHGFPDVHERLMTAINKEMETSQ